MADSFDLDAHGVAELEHPFASASDADACARGRERIARLGKKSWKIASASASRS
jgi:hypothetical protein